MTYNDQNNRSRRGLREENSYTGWIVGGLVAVALIIGIFVMTNRTTTTNTASNPDRGTATAPVNTTRPAAPATTTGSGTPTTAPVAPANR